MLDGKPLAASSAAGIKLFKHIRAKGQDEQLVACEATMFKDGASAVDMVLRRAAISGRVEIDGKVDDHFLDILDNDFTILETVALDAKSYRAIKTKWARTVIERAP